VSRRYPALAYPAPAVRVSRKRTT